MKLHLIENKLFRFLIFLYKTEINKIDNKIDNKTVKIVFFILILFGLLFGFDSLIEEIDFTLFDKFKLWRYFLSKS